MDIFVKMNQRNYQVLHIIVQKRVVVNLSNMEILVFLYISHERSDSFIYQNGIPDKSWLPNHNCFPKLLIDSCIV